MTARIARKSEQQRWDELQQHLADRREKHAKNLPAGCTGCAVGLRWTVEETIRLISMLNFRCIFVAELCEKLNRSASGITSRLIRLGIMRWDGRRVHPVDIVSARKIGAMDPRIVDALVCRGWERTTRNQLRSPMDWCGVRVIYTGIEGAPRNA